MYDIDMSNKVLEQIARKYEQVRKGVKAAMGGRILEYEAKNILNQGMEKGIKGTVSILKKSGVPIQTIQSQIQEQYILLNDFTCRITRKSLLWQ